MKVKLALDSLTFDGLADLGTNIHTAMLANAATFANADPTMPVLDTKVSLLRTKIAARKTADTAAETALEQLRNAAEDLRVALAEEGSYVEHVAKGDAAIIALAGMGVRNPITPIGPMPKVENLKLTVSEAAGAVDWMCTPPKGASAYILQVCTGDPNVEANWKYADTATKSSGTLTGLASGTVWVRVAAKGAAPNPGAWSEPAHEVVH